MLLPLLNCQFPELLSFYSTGNSNPDLMEDTLKAEIGTNQQLRQIAGEDRILIASGII